MYVVFADDMMITYAGKTQKELDYLKNANMLLMSTERLAQSERIDPEY